jgi:hypothetical protein
MRHGMLYTIQVLYKYVLNVMNLQVDAKKMACIMKKVNQCAVVVIKAK